MTFGFSRDDVGSFLPQYIKQGILDKDPFVTIDEKGVGQLIEMSASQGVLGSKLAKKVSTSESRVSAFKAGVCGEHGGDPTSVKYFHRIGLQVRAQTLSSSVYMALYIWDYILATV